METLHDTFSSIILKSVSGDFAGESKEWTQWMPGLASQLHIQVKLKLTIYEN